MATVSKTTAGLAPPPVAVRPAASRPVVWWAGIGAAFAALQTYLFVAWFVSGDASSVDTGVTPVPGYQELFARAQEVFFAVVIAAMIWFLVIRPRRRDGRISQEGLLFGAMFFVWWQDPLFNYTTTTFSYNAVFLNLGGWADHIPGWVSPNGEKFLQPLIWDVSFYIVVSCLALIGATRLIRKVNARWPRLTTGQIFIGLFALVMLLDFLLEFFWVRTGAYAYAGSIDALTIFPSRFYRFPLYEILLATSLFMLWIALWHFRNDKGEMFVERGVSEVRAGPRARTGLRFLALVGGLNLCFLFGNNFWVQVFQVHADSWPRSLQERSFMTHEMCGAGTGYRCAGTNIAIPRRDVPQDRVPTEPFVPHRTTTP